MVVVSISYVTMGNSHSVDIQNFRLFIDEYKEFFTNVEQKHQDYTPFHKIRNLYVYLVGMSVCAKTLNLQKFKEFQSKYNVTLSELNTEIIDFSKHERPDYANEITYWNNNIHRYYGMPEIAKQAISA